MLVVTAAPVTSSLWVYHLKFCHPSTIRLREEYWITTGTALQKTVTQPCVCWCKPVKEQWQITFIDWIDHHAKVLDVTARLLDKTVTFILHVSLPLGRCCQGA